MIVLWIYLSGVIAATVCFYLILSNELQNDKNVTLKDLMIAGGLSLLSWILVGVYIINEVDFDNIIVFKAKQRSDKQ